MSAALYKKPIPGLVAFTIAFLSQWLGHTAWAFTRGAFGEYHEIAELLIGAVGLLLIWLGLNKPEVPATWMGFLGGSLVWVGWFEFGFAYFAKMFAVPDWTSPTGLPVNAGGAMLMATMPLMLALFLMYGFFNRQTKCNMIRWFHRKTGANPGLPTANNGRHYARVTAMETIFVVWFCYLFWLYAGYMLSNTAIMVVYSGWLAWTVYIFIKLLKFPRVGNAVRYGIPVGIVSWGVVEMPSHFGLYSEIWLKPFEYPLTSLAILAVFVAGFVYVASPPDRRAAKQATA